MEHDVIATHLENLDRRLASVEQILPTLATRDEIGLLATKEDLLVLATKDEIQVLATKEEIRLLATKEEIRLLATKEELVAAIAPLATQEGLDELRRHMNILHEDLRSDIRLLAEHVASDRPKHGKG